MKKIVALAAMFVACVNLSVFAKAKVKEQKVVFQRVDWQGATTGKEPPEWLDAVTEGAVEEVGKALKIDTKQNKIFVVASDPGKNLEFIRSWVDNVGVVEQVSGTLSRVVGSAVQADMEGTPEEVERAVKTATTVASSVELIGLEKKAQYWVKTRRLMTGKKGKKDSDYEDPLYTYYVVYVMSNDVFEKSLKSSMERGIPENTDQASVLKQIITASLAQTILPTVQ